MEKKHELLYSETVQSKSRYTFCVILVNGFNTLIIEDLYDDKDPTMTVTNGIEDILSYIHHALDEKGIEMPQLVAYRDTEGRWDQIRPRLMQKTVEVSYGAIFTPMPQLTDVNNPSVVTIAEVLTGTDCNNAQKITSTQAHAQKKNWIAESPENAHGWWIVSDKETGELGSCDGGFSEEDAKIMAAAPDLLYSLQNLVTIVNRMPLSNFTEEEVKQVQDARAAIKKATTLEEVKEN